ncbi:hypothetical protein MTO96_006492 [Rhipicephalus appendiculatus]
MVRSGRGGSKTGEVKKPADGSGYANLSALPSLGTLPAGVRFNDAVEDKVYVRLSLVRCAHRHYRCARSNQGLRSPDRGSR